MAEKTLEEIAAKMKGIDIAMLTTVTEDGSLASRPMSNNGDVDFDGDSYYFTYEESRMVADIEEEPAVTLGFSGADGFYVAVSGDADLIRDKEEFQAHWNPDLDKWFEDGIDTPNIVMIKVEADRLKWWKGEDAGEFSDF
ncbi:pyridoxamine 5'-phosphate oxidase family protein [Tianweitania sp. BSSL-BM11]|uniref:Pyridoxamine 5'-phosphate oxidase family protein n=1 Tax=Tianweitania aestuarii TaxID=2814886 RepID=A0ABS5RUD0_9HYPH|nr:pyridoxamine 5'-phosphate oxidase family protein [Tianweitania aestuarii]MBS9720604.1 pyridoxamine 5'-phosphate oxidase family protein [Tianweitania aestuarii]